MNSIDPAQQIIVSRLEDLHGRLSAFGEAPLKPSAWSKWINRKNQPGIQYASVQGLYIWGGVGRGKTFLMDAFFERLPLVRKQRYHFHRFMQMVHDQLKQLQGSANPLEVVGDHIARQCRVLCFDEFFVSDITDAMILAGLLSALFARGVCLVATSNIPPEKLYENGLQRVRFLPAIQLILQFTEVAEIGAGEDYRLRALESAEIYHYPTDVAGRAKLAETFNSLAPEAGVYDTCLNILGREIPATALADDVGWFQFEALCDGPRSQNDYIEIARCFHAVLLEGVIQFDIKTEAQAKRFIHLIDEFYDRNVKLIITAEVSIRDLYQGEKLQFEFERTRSRLLEMQSKDYLARVHKP